jgi:hypothetical protein
MVDRRLSKCQDRRKAAVEEGHTPGDSAESGHPNQNITIDRAIERQETSLEAASQRPRAMHMVVYFAAFFCAAQRFFCAAEIRALASALSRRRLRVLP